MKFEVTPADGNIFRDIGFPEAEAERLLLLADLTIRIHQIVKERRLSPARATKLFGVGRRRLNAILKFKAYDVTLDSLIEMLARAGLRVRVTVEPIRKLRRVA